MQNPLTVQKTLQLPNLLQIRECAIEASAFSPETRFSHISYRVIGDGREILFLHGAFGYSCHPIDEQINRGRTTYQFLIPDRIGFGRSSRATIIPTDYHNAAAEDVLNFLATLQAKRKTRKLILWGHSDGGVIAGILALRAPEHFAAVVLESCHYFCIKPGLTTLFERMKSAPKTFAGKYATTMASEHGEPYWRWLIEETGAAWLARNSLRGDEPDDFYGGELAALRLPRLVIFGSKDRWILPDEVVAFAKALGQEHVYILPGAGHSPHSESGCLAEFCDLLFEFLKQV